MLNKIILIRNQILKPFNCAKKISSGLLKYLINKMYINYIYLTCMYKEDLVLNCLQWLICQKPNQTIIRF